jgi:hypothetical protein
MPLCELVISHSSVCVPLVPGISTQTDSHQALTNERSHRFATLTDGTGPSLPSPVGERVVSSLVTAA